MKTFTNYMTEDIQSNNERMDSLQKLVKRIANVTGGSVENDKGFNNYYVNARKGEYYAKFLMDPYAYDRTKKHQIIGIAIYHKGRMIYDHIKVSDLNKIVDYLDKTNKIFIKTDAIIIGNKPEEWEQLFKKLNKNFNIVIDELLGKYEIYVNTSYNDPYHKIKYPFFGYNVTSVSWQNKITHKFFGFYDDKLFKDIINYNDILKAIDALNAFIKIAEKIGYK